MQMLFLKHLTSLLDSKDIQLLGTIQLFKKLELTKRANGISVPLGWLYARPFF